MRVYDLSVEAVGRIVPVDLATVDRPPDSALGPFDFHGCSCGVASFVGQPPWELHHGGDELLHILAGETELTVLTEAPRRRVVSSRGMSRSSRRAAGIGTTPRAVSPCCS